MPEAITYQITVRYGDRHVRYHTYAVAAPDARAALVEAADGLPDEIVAETDLVELRVAVEPEGRGYVGHEG